MRSLALKAALGTAILSVSGLSFAGPNDAILLPTAMPDKAELALHPENAEQLTKLAHQVDSILSEAVQDLGLTLTVSDRSRDTLPTDDMLVERAAESWIVSPRVSLEGSGVRLRIVAVAPGQNVLRERTLRFDPQELEVRANVMMRDVVHSVGPHPDFSAPTRAPRARARLRRAAFSGPRSARAECGGHGRLRRVFTAARERLDRRATHLPARRARHGHWSWRVDVGR